MFKVYHNQKAGRRSNEFDATSGNVSAHADGNTELNSVVDYAIADARCHSSTSCLSAKQFYLLRLRSNLERVRLLCELVKKREKFKREFVSIIVILSKRLCLRLSFLYLKIYYV